MFTLLAAHAFLFLVPRQNPSAAITDLRNQASAMSSLVESDLTKNWLSGAKTLPSPTQRTLRKGNTYLTQAQFDALPAEAKAQVKSTEVDDELYYNTKYGTPIAYARPIDLAAKFGFKGFNHAKVMDFGYGGIGQLRLFANLGATAVGVDVDPFLTALYSLPEDQGSFGRGTVKLVQGRFPAEQSAAPAVGGGYDLFISKNTLKRGYIHPERPADKRMLINLGVDDAHFLNAIHDALKPGGLVIIYNLCPAPAPIDKPYVPWADGRSPFSKEQFQNAGFKVLAINVKDDQPARLMAHALSWDEGDGAMDIKNDLFSWYTIARRR